MDSSEHRGGAHVRVAGVNEPTAPPSPSGQAKGGQNGPPTFYDKRSSGATLTQEEAKSQLDSIIRDAPLFCTEAEHQKMMLEANLLVARQSKNKQDGLFEHINTLLQRRAERAEWLDKEDHAEVASPHIVEVKPQAAPGEPVRKGATRRRTTNHH